MYSTLYAVGVFYFIEYATEARSIYFYSMATVASPTRAECC